MLNSIGGFFAFHEPEYIPDVDSIMDRWVGGNNVTKFSNSRSALAELIRFVGAKRIWMPAFICKESCVTYSKNRVKFYPLNENLEPVTEFLSKKVLAGDLVVAVNFFGTPPPQNFIDFAKTRRDVLFLDDRAQALDPCVSFWADWCLYSPRKLLGVADGGILVANSSNRSLPNPKKKSDSVALWRASLWKYEDVDGDDNQIWYREYQQIEKMMTDDCQHMTKLSSLILKNVSIGPLIEKRRKNWLTLKERLGEWLAFDLRGKEAPFGFVIKLDSEERRDRLLAALHAERIFANVHWRTLASPAKVFPREHQLSKQIITLPCDHRYGRSCMEYMADRVKSFL